MNQNPHGWLNFMVNVNIPYMDAMGKGCLMMLEILKVSMLNMTRQPALMALG